MRLPFLFGLFTTRTVSGRVVNRQCCSKCTQHLCRKTVPTPRSLTSAGNNIYRPLTTSNILKVIDKTISQNFDDYYAAVEYEFNTNKRLQALTKYTEDANDPDVQERALKRLMFSEAVGIYIEKNSRTRKRHADFILDALKHMKELGIHRDLECYRALVKVFPEEVMKPTSNFQVEFKHFPRQQDCALEVLEQMSDNGVLPDIDFGLQLLAVFGHKSHVIRKFRRSLYWGRKFLNQNPYQLPHFLPSDPLKLALLALKRMAVDLENELSVWKVKEDNVNADSVFIASAQSPTQRDLIQAHPVDTPLYVEGQFHTWLRDEHLTYFILRADGDPKMFEYPTETEELDDLFEFETVFETEKPRELIPRPSEHQQEDGTILAMCITETSTKDSLINWIRCLQESNPKLEKIPIVFSLQTPEESLVSVNEQDKVISEVVPS